MVGKEMMKKFLESRRDAAGKLLHYHTTPYLLKAKAPV
jgi:hypothetical protein